MGWEEDLFTLFDDLEQQAEGLYDLERGAELADRSRAEYAEVALAGRLAASVGREVGLDVRGVGRIAGRLERVARGWCLVRGEAQDWVVRTEALAAVYGASPRSVPEVAWSPVARLGVGSALRRIGEGARRCVLHRLDGTRHDGVLRRVGADFVELVPDGREGPEGPGGPEQVVLVALSSLAAVQSRD